MTPAFAGSYVTYLIAASVVMTRQPLPPWAIAAAFVAPMFAYFGGRTLVRLAKPHVVKAEKGADANRFSVSRRLRKLVRRIVRILLVLAWVINAADVTFTLNALFYGTLDELNPFVSWWIGNHWYLTPAYKYSLLAFATGVIIRAAKRWSALIGAILILAISICLSFHWFAFFQICPNGWAVGVG